ncbi:MAG: hypothetical protein U0Y96_06785 [Candidatus Kapaibacterium sp.]
MKIKNKKIISTAINASLESKKLFILTLKSAKSGKRIPREDRMTLEISSNLPKDLRDYNLPQYCITDNQNKKRYIDLVQFRSDSISFQCNEIEWGLEAKHYSPHQNISNLNHYIRNSIRGITSDIDKLTNCGIENKYLVALQTEVKSVQLNDNDINTVFQHFPFIRTYIGDTKQEITNNIVNVSQEDRINNLKESLTEQIDNDLIYDSASKTITLKDSSINVRIHYFVLTT